MREVTINNITEATTLETLGKMLKLAVLDNTSAKYDRNQKSYIPRFEKGDIVECEFIGIGNEFNKKHFAIVWIAKADEPTISVIPLTSKNKGASKAHFSIGVIENFITQAVSVGEVATVRESYVYIDKICEVSRNRVETWYQKDTQGKIIRDKGKLKSVKLSCEQIERIKEGMRLTLLDEGQTLVDVLKRVHKKWLIDINRLASEIYKHGHRELLATQFKEANQEATLIYQLKATQFQTYTIHFKEITDHQFSSHTSHYNKIERTGSIITSRNNVFKALFSQQNSLVQEAKDIINDIILS